MSGKILERYTEIVRGSLKPALGGEIAEATTSQDTERLRRGAHVGPQDTKGRTVTTNCASPSLRIKGGAEPGNQMANARPKPRRCC